MTAERIGIILNGATGGLATSQHLRALLAIRAEGGLPLADGRRVLPDPILLGRSADKLRRLAAASGIERWSTALDAALANPDDTIFFDAAATGGRHAVLTRAIAAGKHVYSEKPIAETLDQALDLARAADRAGIRHGTVQDKVFLPGFRKLGALRASGWFGRILEARLESSRWVFDGTRVPANRASWNYRKRDGGGVVLDMFPHWRYMLDQLVGEVRAVSCTTRTHVPRRLDEAGQPYTVDVEDAVFAQFELEGGILASVNTSWCSRVRREDAMILQVDGTEGSAVATAQECWIQPDAATPLASMAVDAGQGQDYRAQWLAVPDRAPRINSYRAGWEAFLRHVLDGAPFASPLLAGAKGVQLADLAYRSDRERRWIAVPALTL